MSQQVSLTFVSHQYTTLAALHRRISIWKMLAHWTLTFFGNLAGSLFIVGIIIGYGGVLDDKLYREEAIKFADKKAYTPQWHQIFLRAIGANWLVCVACWLAFQARDVASKIAAIWWPVFAFVALGLDHVVANMYFIPLAIFLGSPTISVGYYIWKSMIPALIGNILGGGLFVAVVHWYLVGRIRRFLLSQCRATISILIVEFRISRESPSPFESTASCLKAPRSPHRVKIVALAYEPLNRL